MSRKRGPDPGVVIPDTTAVSDNSDNNRNISEAVTAGDKPKYVFKNPNFKHFNVVGNKKKPWRTLKQILAAEQSLSWPDEAVTYSSLEAPPSFRPAKKYSDLSGLEAAYTDPQTKLNYACSEEFAEIRKQPSDIVEGFLALRKANTQLQ